MAFVTIKDINDYQFVPKLSVDNFDGKAYELFGNDVFFRDDYWLRNVHVKVTDRCNAKCDFCVEKDSHVKENKWNLLNNLSSLLHQMNEQGLLSTVTITGGEPTLCKHLGEVLDCISRYNVFSSMNTHGRGITKMEHAPTWINISKHDVYDNDIFKLPTIHDDIIQEIRENTGSKIRLQGLLLPNRLDSIQEILNFIELYKDVVDDFGFRQLIKSDDNYKGVSLLPFRAYLYENAKFVEQVIQDYYVYETWTLDGTNITLSMSDMQMLIKNEQVEDARHLREVIVHPDGMVSGDWSRQTKVLSR